MKGGEAGSADGARVSRGVRASVSAIGTENRSSGPTPFPALPGHEARDETTVAGPALRAGFPLRQGSADGVKASVVGQVRTENRSSDPVSARTSTTAAQGKIRLDVCWLPD